MSRTDHHGNRRVTLKGVRKIIRRTSTRQAAVAAAIREG